MRDGKWTVALVYLASSVVLGLLGAAAGMSLARV
jgi:fluoride ion exporter CrcB/FEX